MVKKLTDEAHIGRKVPEKKVLEVGEQGNRGEEGKKGITNANFPHENLHSKDDRPIKVPKSKRTQKRETEPTL